jgi:putative peptide zinc metalloprotease protein
LVGAPARSVRAEVAGFVTQLHVEEGERVRAGQVLATLDNPELLIEKQLLELDVRQARLRLDELRDDGNRAAVQVQQQYLDSILKQLDEMTRHMGHLVLVSPVNGRVVTPHPEHLRHRFVQAGAEVITVVGEGREVLVSVDQHDVDRFIAWVGRPLQVFVAGRAWATLRGTLLEVNPHGEDTILQPALSATNGGPLAVRLKPSSAEIERPTATEVATGDGQVSFVSPRFSARVAVSSDVSLDGYLGRVASVRFRPTDRSVGSHLSETIRRFLSRRLQRSDA